ncbi:D-Tyr tRNAtyr deacylase-like domain-containing protein [Ustulina deusta]|nr:D-Tyr tRNAtyr deacylase-like domain-containing protein [Ustulina deusta]
MKAILQRVLSASVTVEKEVVSSIGKGVLVFAAVAPGDTQKEADSLAAKVLKMKLWDDDTGAKVWLRYPLLFIFVGRGSDLPIIPFLYLTCVPSQWKYNVQEIGGEVLCVSQFTLLASTKKGNKPDFHGAAGGEEAKRLYHYFFEKVQQGYGPDKVHNGVFQAMMEVALVNDGPVTLEISALPKADLKAEKKAEKKADPGPSSVSTPSN